MLTWTSRNGRTYTIDDTSNLVDWLELQDGVESDGDSTTTTISGANLNVRYFRVREE